MPRPIFSSETFTLPVGPDRSFSDRFATMFVVFSWLALLDCFIKLNSSDERLRSFRIFFFFLSLSSSFSDSESEDSSSLGRPEYSSNALRGYRVERVVLSPEL